MTYGFKVVTGVGNTIVYDENSPPPGFVLEEFDVAQDTTVTKNYSSSGCTQLLPYAFTYVDPNNVNRQGYPKVVVTGLSVTITNIHPYGAYGFGGTVRVCILGR